MKLLKFLNFCSRNRGGRHHHCDGRFHHNNHLRMYETKDTFSNGKNKKMCPICKNHCDLVVPKCKRGEEYVKGKLKVDSSSLLGEIIINNGSL